MYSGRGESHPAPQFLGLYPKPYSPYDNLAIMQCTNTLIQFDGPHLIRGISISVQGHYLTGRDKLTVASEPSTLRIRRLADDGGDEDAASGLATDALTTGLSSPCHIAGTIL